MVDPDTNNGHTEPYKNSTNSRSTKYRECLYQSGWLIWTSVSWPWRWWGGGDHNRRTANFTVLLAFGTLALAGVNLFMLLEMQSAGVDTKRAIKATNRLAYEAKRSADNAIKTAERQLRAYIGFEDIKLYHLDNLLTIYILNGGQTPAYNVHCQGTFYDMPFGQVLPQGFTYPEPPDAAIALGSGTFIPGHKEPAGVSLDGLLIARMIRAKNKIISLTAVRSISE